MPATTVLYMKWLYNATASAMALPEACALSQSGPSMYSVLLASSLLGACIVAGCKGSKPPGAQVPVEWQAHGQLQILHMG